jgi:hypothetical protein
MEQQVDIPNAFVGKRERPTPRELETALGPVAPLWNQLVASLACDHSVQDQEWSSYSPKYGWSLKLKLKKRTILYLGPCAGCFRASFVLGDRAVAEARKSKLPASVLKLLEEAPKYSEGTGLRLTITSARNIPSVIKLAQIKLDN